MIKATLYFQGELKAFLPADLRPAPLTIRFNAPVTVKHLIEAQRVPPTNVTAIVVNGRSVDFSHQPADGDRIDLYPAAVDCEVTPLRPLRPPLPAEFGFVLDNHLGTLARYLRLLGFDTLYPDNSDDPYLAQLSFEQERVLLSRDRALFNRKIVVYGYCLLSRDPREQLTAVLRRYQLAGATRPWRRCLRCNGLLQPVDKEKIMDQLEPKTKQYYNTFHQCQACGQIFWRGSHFAELERFVAEMHE